MMKTRKQLLEEADKQLRRIREEAGIGFSEKDAELLNNWMYDVGLHLLDPNEYNLGQRIKRYFDPKQNNGFAGVTPEGQQTGVELMTIILTMYDNEMARLKKFEKDYKKVNDLYKKFKQAKL